MDGVTISSQTKYSDELSFRLCTGSAALHIVSTAGTLAISQQCCIVDKITGVKTWFDPVDVSGAELGVVRAVQTVTAGTFVIFDPVITEWIRFKVVESTASTVVTLKLISREEV
jgi:uncharacterized membrane protein (DUF441 family)